MRYLIPAICFILIFSSCTDNSKNSLAVFKANEGGLLKSTETISHENMILYSAFQSKLEDPNFRQYAITWNSKVKLIKELSYSTYLYIDKLIGELSVESHTNFKSSRSFDNENDKSSVFSLFKTKGKARELYEKLKKYKQDMLSIDPDLEKQFGNNSIIITEEFDGKKSNLQAFTNTFFTNTPLVAANSLLRGFEVNVLIMENNFLSYCFNKINPVMIIDDFIMPLVSLSSSCVKGGDKIGITAGIGVFSTTPDPIVTINNTVIPLNEVGITTYNFKTPLKPGKYFIPVKVEFTKPDGTNDFMTKNISYTVVE